MPSDHEHRYTFATQLMQTLEAIDPQTRQPTGKMLSRPSMVMLCACGHHRHVWITEPEELAARPKPLEIAHVLPRTVPS